MAELVERRISSLDGLIVMVIRVMDVQDVDSVSLQPLQALIERAHHAVKAEIKYRLEGRRVVKLIFLQRAGLNRLKHPAHLSG